MVHGTQGGPAAREAEIKAPANKVETHLKPILREGSIQSQLLGGGGGAPQADPQKDCTCGSGSAVAPLEFLVTFEQGDWDLCFPLGLANGVPWSGPGFRSGREGITSSGGKGASHGRERFLTRLSLLLTWALSSELGT